jgi:hypothetical protein
MMAEGMKKGGDLARTAVQQRLVLALDRNESADAGPDVDADVGRVGRGNLQRAVIHGELWRAATAY